MQYPLLFPNGTDGWHVNLKLRNSGRKLMAMVYYRYHIMVRENVSVLLRAKRLFQQYLVDAYCKIETERLQFLRREQTALRADCYQDLRDAILEGDGDRGVRHELESRTTCLESHTKSGILPWNLESSVR